MDEVQRLRKALNELDCERDELESSLRARDESAAALEEQLRERDRAIESLMKANREQQQHHDVQGQLIGIGVAPVPQRL